MAYQNGNLAIVITREPQAVLIEQDNSNLRRGDFPEGFVFGTGTSAFQVEGAAAVDGKGASVWDDFTLRTPHRIADGSNGNVAADMYNRFKLIACCLIMILQEDIRTMKAMGFDVYRFSISWPRILPGGRPSAGINRKGIDYYNELIDTIIAHELCFWEFGDRVKFWTTINEPWTVAVHGYVRGTFPPSKVSCPPERVLTKLPTHRCIQHPDACVPITRTYSDVKYDKSEPAKDTYIAARNLLLCHAATVNLYRTKFEVFQKGQIGIVLNSHWYVPLDKNSPDDV
ncbi:Raucaffricine beta-glucosidase [Handroanthus impetiginosus]|uniref:Raucaffricine beta-glucosidase n=1 Tax=Handroanthus impetiginosus TaxID=429701 RepID=A0A2G9GGQ1_9LAMI|nr:Raucaffricine beta-glucosidase [Handroanthus impetiginosus]